MSDAMPEADINKINAPHWEALSQGNLIFQRCANGHAWLPARSLCPTCLSKEWQWTKAQGTGRIVSWVVFHHAYHPAFKDRVPYNVALVAFDEGPRLLTNVLAPNEALQAEAKVTLAVDTTLDRPLATFVLAKQ